MLNIQSIKIVFHFIQIQISYNIYIKFAIYKTMMKQQECWSEIESQNCLISTQYWTDNRSLKRDMPGNLSYKMVYILIPNVKAEFASHDFLSFQNCPVHKKNKSEVDIGKGIHGDLDSKDLVQSMRFKSHKILQECTENLYKYEDLQIKTILI